MVGKSQKRLILGAILLICALPLSAQSASGQTDSLVRLLNAQYLEQVETNGRMARKAIAPTFLHNGTYLICDTALWRVDDKLINCYGHVQLMQGESVLTSETLDYLIDQDLAQFRGGVVQLRNKRDNILRTRILDYNTKDSIAVFRGGASMISEDGQIIESDDGTYSNALSLFTFMGDVNMFADSVFVRTTLLDYDSEAARADFRSEIDFWKDGNMLSAGGGWYERNMELFFFRDDVHGLGSTQESWSDSLYFYRNTNDLKMLGNIQIQDQSRKVAAMGDRLNYVDSLSRVVLESRASAAIWDGEGANPDTTYLGASRFIYHTQKKCDIPEAEIKVAAARLEEMLGDPVTEYRRRAAQQAAEAAEQARRDDPAEQAMRAARRAGAISAASNASGPSGSGAASSDDWQNVSSSANSSPQDVISSEAEKSDTLGLTAPTDSLAVQLDTIPPPPDTSKIGFLLATGDVRVFRKDMQVRCDSLRYSDLDSIARLYKDPVVWNEIRRQYNSDSLFVLIRENRMERANLMSNAFIHTEESDGYFDQIKSTDVLAYFSDSTALKRFDALGGVTSLLFLEENEVIATVNKTESKMMMATFDEAGNVDHVYNFDSPKSDAYPVVQMPAAELKLKGFNWQPERRPQNKYDVTSMVVRDSEREAYEARPEAQFRQTEIYFPGHMKEVYAALEDAKAKKNARQSGEPEDVISSPSDVITSPSDVISSEAEKSPADTLRDPSTLLGMTDDLSAVRDSSSFAGRDSSSFAGLTGESPRDSLSVISSEAEKSPSDTTWMSDRELRRALRIARRDARWAELDARDAEKLARKEARKAERKARRAARIAKAEARQAAIDEAKLQKYIEYYQKKKARDEARKQKSVPAGERPPGVEAGGELPTPVESE